MRTVVRCAVPLLDCTFSSNFPFPPALIFHGEKDERVPLPQSYETYIALRKFGVPVELVMS